jgi:hypothetical protein
MRWINVTRGRQPTSGPTARESNIVSTISNVSSLNAGLMLPSQTFVIASGPGTAKGHSARDPEGILGVHMAGKDAILRDIRAACTAPESPVVVNEAVATAKDLTGSSFEKRPPRLAAAAEWGKLGNSPSRCPATYTRSRTAHLSMRSWRRLASPNP